MMPVADEDYAMSAVLQPTSTEQVQEIVRNDLPFFTLLRQKLIYYIL